MPALAYATLETGPPRPRDPQLAFVRLDVPADPTTCSARAARALAADPHATTVRTQNRGTAGAVVWMQSDISLVLAWCAPNRGGVVAAVAAHSYDWREADEAVRRVERSLFDAHPVPRAPPEITRPNAARTPGAQPRERAATVGFQTRNGGPAAYDCKARVSESMRAYRLRTAFFKDAGLVIGESRDAVVLGHCMDGYVELVGLVRSGDRPDAMLSEMLRRTAGF